MSRTRATYYRDMAEAIKQSQSDLLATESASNETREKYLILNALYYEALRGMQHEIADYPPAVRQKFKSFKDAP